MRASSGAFIQPGLRLGHIGRSLRASFSYRSSRRFQISLVLDNAAEGNIGQRRPASAARLAINRRCAAARLPWPYSTVPRPSRLCGSLGSIFSAALYSVSAEVRSPRCKYKRPKIVVGLARFTRHRSRSSAPAHIRSSASSELVLPLKHSTQIIMRRGRMRHVFTAASKCPRPDQARPPSISATPRLSSAMPFFSVTSERVREKRIACAPVANLDVRNIRVAG